MTAAHLPILLALAATIAAAGTATGARTAASASAGVYSESQAGSGALLYTQRCAMCHGRTLEGTYEIPGLTGKFLANWGKRPLGDLYDYIDRAMPQFAPRSLSPAENAALTAFLLKANGFPPGAESLPADGARLRGIAFDAPGPPGK